MIDEGAQAAGRRYSAGRSREGPHLPALPASRGAQPTVDAPHLGAPASRRHGLSSCTTVTLTRRRRRDADAPRCTRTTDATRMDTPSLIVTNARVLTMDQTRPTAGRVTVRGGLIAALDGPIPEDALVIDCRGGVLLPGFVDPHVHLLAAAAAARSVDCSPRAVRSIREIQERIAATAAGSAGWVRAVGYDESALKEGRHPTRWDLDAAVPDRPVRLLHRSGHAAVLNSRALALAGIDIATEEPPGGVIDRRLDDGEPTGLLMDMDAVIDRVVPPLPRAELVAGMRAVGDVLLAAGVSAVQDLTHTNDAARTDLLERVWLKAGLTPQLLSPATRPNGGGRGPVKLMLGEAGGLSRAQADELTAA